ncbi:MAG: DUF167 domain-containing protein [Candidatus Micrarchaeota archaeon]
MLLLVLYFIPTGEPLLLEVKVTPNAKKFGFRYKDGWKVSVVSRPEKGKANAELEKELAALLQCEIRVRRGFTSRKKLLEVGLDEDEFERRTKNYREAQGP